MALESIPIRNPSADVTVCIAEGRPVLGSKSGGSIAGTMVQVIVSLRSIKKVP